MFNSSTQVSLRPIVMKSPPDFPHQTPGTVRHAPNTKHQAQCAHQTPCVCAPTNKHQTPGTVRYAPNSGPKIHSPHQTPHIGKGTFFGANFSKTGSSTFSGTNFFSRPIQIPSKNTKVLGTGRDQYRDPSRHQNVDKKLYKR